MRERLRKRVVAIGGAALIVVILAGAGVWIGVSQYADQEGRVKEGQDSVRIELDDERGVLVRYGKEGLVERHQTTPSGPWSKPEVIYGKKEYDCESITLATHSGTVAAIADYGYGCPAGSPPDDSLAAVSDGDLADWDVNSRKNFDGWERIRFSRTGGRVVFERVSGTKISWRSPFGFT
jgi:hypothetical protein